MNYIDPNFCLSHVVSKIPIALENILSKSTLQGGKNFTIKKHRYAVVSPKPPSLGAS